MLGPYAQEVVSHEKSKDKYIRVVYEVFEGIWERPVDAPPPSSRLPFEAFIGRGAIWQFYLRQPRTPLEKGSCKTIFGDPEFEDEMGKVKIPRYIPTPGAQIDNMPPIESLSCYALERDGLQRLDSEKLKASE